MQRNDFCDCACRKIFPVELDIDILETWLDMGCIFQSNRTSFLGFHGKRNQQNAKFLLENKMIHLIASDIHRTDGHRIEMLSDIYDYVRKKVGEDNAKLLLYKNPYSILMDEEVAWMQ